ncbi:MAG: quinolinate synthase NadA [Firmicutes bacterium]|nr:quinolinate synthase NadA [Bacillota bacterium]
MYDTNTLYAEIRRLQQERSAVILAHYYQTGDIQDIADFVGDSYGLSKLAKDTDADVIVFCGVSFMAETAKILSPTKTVLLPAPDAGCPMADMVTPEDVLRLRAQYPDAAVACYVNSSAGVKAVSDVCVTSSNAVKIVRALRETQVIFVPDQNLGRYVAGMLPEKEIILHPGYCRVHHRLTAQETDAAVTLHPGAPLLAHPECTRAVLDKADFIGSTAQILQQAKRSKETEFIIATEEGILHELHRQNPEKTFHLLSNRLTCVNMKKTRLTDVRDALLLMQYQITLEEDVMRMARRSLDRMLELAK